ncbi:MAG: hypothetical protein Q7T04_06965 [Dehalococcoidia bacterium]|nr:hypothetical protein [Dehalococcoidia bacterium]
MESASDFSLDYFIFVLIVYTSAIQMGAALGGFSGLSWFRHRSVGFMFSFLVAVVANVWFFNSTDRNVRSVVEGSQQFGFFVGAGFLALVINTAFSSLVRARDFRQNSGPGAAVHGLEALRQTTFFHAVARNFRRK